MKLVLANNQSQKFVDFYANLGHQSGEAFDYAGYEQLLFTFDGKGLDVRLLQTGKSIRDYDGVYLSGYLNTYELAAAIAVCLSALHIPFADAEFANPPSLSKLSEYAKLAANEVPIPRTSAGTKKALLAAELSVQFPQILKRADAARGADNFKVANMQELHELLAPHAPRSLWVLQDFVPNDGFWRVTFYGDNEPAFAIFRAMGERADGDVRKSHIYKPKGGANASLVPMADVPETVLAAARAGAAALGRQFAGVDIVQDAAGRAYVLEVNYNPQLVTVGTFAEVRAQAFVDGLRKIH